MDRIIIIVCIICFFPFNYSQAQQNKNLTIIDTLCIDTFFCDGYSLSLQVPHILYTHKLYYQYEEGFFMTYPYKDSAYIFVHKGYNAKRPFCDTTHIKLFFENDTIKCYYGVLNNVFCKEIYYKERGITISYVNIREEDLLLFEKIISTLRFIPLPSNGKMNE